MSDTLPPLEPALRAESVSPRPAPFAYGMSEREEVATLVMADAMVDLTRAVFRAQMLLRGVR